MKIQLASALACWLPCIMIAEPIQYPEAERLDLVEDLHGVKVADPYRWLEEVDSEQTKAWIAAQNEISDAYFAAAPGREWIEKRLTELWDYDKYGLPRQTAGRLFFTRKSGLQNQGILYWNEDKPGAEPVVLLDPNTLSEDGTIALSSWSISDDGKLLAYGISEGGSDWMEWRVRDVETGKDLEDHLEWIKFSGAAWKRDSTGFYYSRYPEPAADEELEAVNLNQKVYFHRIRDPQSKDQLVYERPDHPKWGFSNWVTEDGRFLTLSVWESSGDKNAFIYKDLEAGPDAPFVEMIPDIEAEYSILGNDGTTFYFKTNLTAPNGRVIAIDSANPDAKPREIVPESENPLDDISLIGQQLLAKYMVDVQMQVKIFDLEGKPVRDVELPGVGSVYGFGGKRKASETFYYFTGYTEPGAVYRYDLKTGKTSLFAKPETAFDSSQFETRQVFYKSKDGTKVPMFITCRKDIKLNGQNPTYLYGYGGFNISLTPSFRTSIATWLEMGGVYAVANLRGGGEYGEDWHLAGTKAQKQNVFDDFHSAAEFLIEEGYTNTPKLAIAGGSNGGLLVGACVNQRPELYGAAIASVGVFDMLRFHKFTIGWAWTEDFGDPDKAEEFPALFAYSPYHKTQSEKPYPALLITTADHDDRVFPAHSFKFGAAVQHAQSGDAPILMRIETKAGHGAGKPTSKQIEEVVDRWSFLVRELKIKMP
ncbi:MAG: prolyl oligopeptidase [Verrucomicrobiales bacterium]|jgi:prolyl oligopeptidase